MSTGLHKLHVPLLLRVALIDLAERRGQTEEQVLEDLIRDGVRRELLREDRLRPEEGADHEDKK